MLELQVMIAQLQETAKKNKGLEMYDGEVFMIEAINQLLEDDDADGARQVFNQCKAQALEQNISLDRWSFVMAEKCIQALEDA